MWSSSCRRVLHELLHQPLVRGFRSSAAQNTVVVERMWQVPLSKIGSPPRLNPRRHRIYKLVEDSKHSRTGKMELILTQTVPKLGGRGDTVFVKKSVGRNKLLPEGLAVYPSPENKEMFAEELRRLKTGSPGERIQTRTGLLTVEFLKKAHLKMRQMPVEEFQLSKEVVIRGFLKQMLLVVPPHAMNFPFEGVKELGDYWCEITVNGLDVVRVPVSVVPYVDLSASYRHQLRAQRQQEEAAAILPEVPPTAADEEKEDNVLKAVSETPVKAEKEAVESLSAEEPAATTQTEKETTPTPPSENPETK